MHRRNNWFGFRRSAAFSVILLSSAILLAEPAQIPALQKAREAFDHAQQLEATLNEKSPEQRTRDEYLNVIKSYQRVYVITPHTGYADNALVTMARLYEEMRDARAAVRTLTYLIREYPGTPFRDVAERDIARLQGVPERKLASASVDNIRFWEAAGSVRVVVDLSSEVEFKQGEAKSPDRAFIDISPARLNSMLKDKAMPLKTTAVQQIRVGQFDNSTVRVVLDLGTFSRVSSSILREPDRLIIDVAGIEPPAPNVASVIDEPVRPALLDLSPVKLPNAAVTRPVPNVVPPPPPTPPAPPVVPKATVAKAPAVETKITPAKPTANGDRSLVRSLGLKLRKVVIDAGHGGHDTGTVGPSGYTEKELVLDVSRRLKEMLETQLGAEVVMTRTDDTFVPLEDRTTLANEQEGDLFISIHANSSTVRTVRGVETFYLNYTTSRATIDLQTRENAASDRSIHEIQDLFRKILLQDKVDESRELARFIQKSMFARKNSGPDRGVKPALFVVLIGAEMPSILAEISFISNPQEEKLLRSSEYRQQIAESLFNGVRSYSESLGGVKTTAKSQDKNQE